MEKYQLRVQKYQSVLPVYLSTCLNECNFQIINNMQVFFSKDSLKNYPVMSFLVEKKKKMDISRGFQQLVKIPNWAFSMCVQSHTYWKKKVSFVEESYAYSLDS